MKKYKIIFGQIVIGSLIINPVYAYDCLKTRLKDITSTKSKIIIKNRCDFEVEMRNAAISLYSTRKLGDSYWGRFTPLSQPIDTTIESQQIAYRRYLAKMLLTFPDNQTTITKLPPSERIIIKFRKPRRATLSDLSLVLASSQNQNLSLLQFQLPEQPAPSAPTNPTITINQNDGQYSKIIDNAQWGSTYTERNLKYGSYSIVVSNFDAGTFKYEGQALPNTVNLASPEGSEISVSYKATQTDPQPDPQPDPKPNNWWKPTSENLIPWHIQYTGTLDTNQNVQVYNIDLFETPISTIESLKNKNIKIMCYFSAGSSEDWREDFKDFPPEVLGNNLAGWPGERWLDIRSPIVMSIMKKRLQLAHDKGCDAVDPDNVDGYYSKSGFPLTAQDQLEYLNNLANEAHQLNLAIGLKNNVEQASALSNLFDFSVNEECAQYDECEYLNTFINKNKPVFWIEYQGNINKSTACQIVTDLKLNLLIKNRELDAWQNGCW